MKITLMDVLMCLYVVFVLSWVAFLVWAIYKVVIWLTSQTI